MKGAINRLTVLSRPSIMIMRKKIMEKKVEAGMLAMASAYMMNSRLGPGDAKRQRIKEI